MRGIRDAGLDAVHARCGTAKPRNIGIVCFKSGVSNLNPSALQIRDREIGCGALRTRTVMNTNYIGQRMTCLKRMRVHAAQSFCVTFDRTGTVVFTVRFGVKKFTSHSPLVRALMTASSKRSQCLHVSCGIHTEATRRRSLTCASTWKINMWRQAV